jgi:hypothetical protein
MIQRYLVVVWITDPLVKPAAQRAARLVPQP